MMASVPTHPTRRRWWLLAIPVLAAGLAWGAHLFTGAPQAETTSATSTPSSFRPVIAFGHVDVEGRIKELPFTVPGGRVTEVLVKEGESVPAGAVLARLDDTLARKKIDEAQAGLAAARAELDRGRSLPEQHRIKLEQAQSAIEAAEAQRNAFKLELQRKRELAGKNLLNAQDIPIAEQQLRGAEEGLRIKQNDLKQLRLMDPKTEVLMLEAQATRAEALLAQAQAAIKEYALVAPTPGTVLQISVGVGHVVTGGPMLEPAIRFCPEGPRIIRAYVEQAFAAQVAEGQRVTIDDDTHAAGQWTGRVKRVPEWYSNQRPVIQPDPNQYSDVRAIECVIALDPDQPRLRINQRVRVTIEVPVK
jgi:multidrug resistance efflux pump